MSLEPWRRNLFAVTGATFLGFASFTLVMPFLPLYFRELGLTDTASIAMWSGLSLGVTPAMTAVLAPTWGLLADRFGLKLMVTRSLVSCVLLMLALANVTEPWHVFALRALQGLFAGYGGLVLTMAADAAPPQKVAHAIGTVQTAQRLGPALGPVIGGTLAAWVGLRQSFYVAALVYALSVLLLWMGYHQPRPRAVHGREPAPPDTLSLRGMLTLENCTLLLVAVFVLQFAERTFGPTLPLYVAEMVGHERSLAVAGTLFSLMAGAGAIGNLSAAWSLQRASSRQVVVAALALSSAGAMAFLAAPGPMAMMAAAVVFGAGVGLASTVVYAVAGAVIPPSARARGFGFLTSASLAGMSISPMASGLVGAMSLRAVFVATSLMLAGLAAAVWGLMHGGAARDTSDTPVAEEV